jgi:transketolase
LATFLQLLGEGLTRRPDRAPYLVTCDSAHSFGLPGAFRISGVPHIDVGVREAGAIGVAAGLATAGYDPYVACFAAFGVLRGAEALRTLIAAERLPVTLLAGMAGLSAGFDGVSHHCLEDLGVLRSMPQIRVYIPSDTTTSRAVVDDLLGGGGPAYVRLVRHPVPDAPGTLYSGFRQLRPGTGGDTVVGYGPALIHALPAIASLPEPPGVVEVLRVNPLPPQLGPYLAGGGKLFVVEEHVPHGGLGDRLRARFPELSARVETIGVAQDPGSGAYPELLHATGLAGDALAMRIHSERTV